MQKFIVRVHAFIYTIGDKVAALILNFKKKLNPNFPISRAVALLQILRGGITSLSMSRDSVIDDLFLDQQPSSDID